MEFTQWFKHVGAIYFINHMENAQLRAMKRYGIYTSMNPFWESFVLSVMSFGLIMFWDYVCPKMV